jgi:hypothetical protein
MIKINNDEYDQYDIKISWGKFVAFSHGEKRTGIAPFITFNIENNIFIGLELTISREMFQNIEIGTKIEINKYITDIIYEDEQGWISIGDAKYYCDILREDDKCLKINFYVKCDGVESIEISIDDHIELQ